jgi:hypothetical protein
MKNPKGRARKLCPRFIGPYRVSETQHETSNYVLELPVALQGRRIHPKQGRGGQRPPYCEPPQATSSNDDFVMNEAERGVGTGTTSSFASSLTPSTQPMETDWGVGDPNWGGQTPQARDPLPPQSSAFSSSSITQPRRTTSAPSQAQEKHQFNGLGTSSGIPWAMLHPVTPGKPTTAITTPQIPKRRPRLATPPYTTTNTRGRL